MYILFAFILLLYTLLNYWIGTRIWQGLFCFLPYAHNFRIIYWLIFYYIAFSYILSHLPMGFLPPIVAKMNHWIGGYWMGAMVYIVLILFLMEIFRVVDRYFQIIPIPLKENPIFPLIIGTSVLVLMIGILVYGTWNAFHPIVHRYDITMNKQAGDLENLHVVMVSDIHLGNVHQNDTLNRLVTQVNELNPDILIFAGDIFDSDVQVYTEQKMADLFGQFRAKYGVYGALGNHEYIGKTSEDVIKNLGDVNVNILRDEVVEVANSFYVIGRDDISAVRLWGTKRKALKSLVQPLDRSLPIILIDHQPSQTEEAMNEEIDLQLSGHTHRGQFWPINFITSRIFPIDWGLLQKGTYHLIVSNGYGTWGPPLRVGNTPEIVDIYIDFNQGE